jgi:hypothetical protein
MEYAAIVDAAKALLARIGWKGAIIAVLVIVVGVQTTRLEGFKLWPLHMEGYVAKADRLEHEVAAFKEAQKQATRAQQKINDDRRQVTDAIATGVDDNANIETPAAHSSTDAYIRDHRLRPQAVGGTRGSAHPASASEGPGDTQAASTASQLDAAPADQTGPIADDTLVVATAKDLRVCTDNTLTAEAGVDYASQLEAATR